MYSFLKLIVKTVVVQWSISVTTNNAFKCYINLFSSTLTLFFS